MFSGRVARAIGVCLVVLAGAYAQDVASLIDTSNRVAVADEIHEMRFDAGSMTWSGRVETARPDLKSRYLDALTQARFRYTGSENNSLVFAVEGTGVDGVAWADSATKRILRAHINGPDYKADMSFAAVSFKSERAPLWLPAKITVETGTLHVVHRYSDYRLVGNNDAGRTAPPADFGKEDSVELLARAAALIRSSPGEAVRTLQESLRLDPDRAATHYQLGAAYLATGDLADAEAELRDAVAQVPGSALVHNYLGIVLFQKGDAKAAVEEFRAAAKFAPKDPNAHFNLAEALARAGDRGNAVEEIQNASALSPEDTGLARLAKDALSTDNTPTENKISVDVRQVLVPVIVTDREGHHATGLTRADFKVFEDGVEQKITAFSVESTGSPEMEASAGPETARGNAPSSSPPPPPGHAPVRRTYLICVDTLHASFNNFVAAREALAKLFAQEHSADSQYVVVTLGTSAEMALNVTQDPAAVLAIFQSKKFQKFFLDGQMGGIKPELERYRRSLNETRLACDLSGTDRIFQVKCETGMARAQNEASEIAELDRTMTIGFLRQFRNLVAQLARARDRRTIVLVSDGFQIVPGREAYDLLNAFFPFASHCLVPPAVACLHSGMQALERMQDEFEPILRLAAKSNITIDTIDSRGLYGQAAFDASNPGNSVTVDGSVGRVERSVAADDGNTLAEIAEATGGTAFHDSNNLLAGLQRAFADGRDYYTIAYVSANANLDGKFRAVSVQVRNPKLMVKAKRGYWATAQ